MRIGTFTRYALSGGLATGTHFIVLLMLVESLEFPAPSATALGALCGVLIAYLANRHFTFSRMTSHRHALPRFFAIAGVGAGLNSLIVWSLTYAMQWHYLTAQTISTIVVFALTYHLNRSWTFVC